jgi:hypothetical protein
MRMCLYFDENDVYIFHRFIEQYNTSLNYNEVMALIEDLKTGFLRCVSYDKIKFVNKAEVYDILMEKDYDVKYDYDRACKIINDSI